MIGRLVMIGAAVAGLALAGCDSLPDDQCTTAADKLDNCGIPNDSPGHCDNAVDRCEADCINAYSCADISAALAGTPNAYAACDDACH